MSRGTDIAERLRALGGGVMKNAGRKGKPLGPYRKPPPPPVGWPPPPMKCADVCRAWVDGKLSEGRAVEELGVGNRITARIICDAWRAENGL